MTSATTSGYVPLNERPQGGHAKLLALVGEGKRVLDIGCSSGYLARPLVARGSTVVGIERDPVAAEEARAICAEVLVGDAETIDLPFEPGSFDVVLCGDLVEHLRDPGTTLARLRPLLRHGGRLALSTPNVANWAMRLSLLAGRWRYTERGILDRTHADTGVCSEGFSTEPLPQKIDGNAFQATLGSGVLNEIRRAATPTGRRRVSTVR